jgi:outer membrane protein assembly factor BamB
VYITGHGAFGTAQGVLEARNAQSGGLIFHAALPDYVYSSPAFANGRVYFGTANNGSGPAVLYAYKVGPAPTQDPTGT